jgi:hypothetical protein
MNAELRPQHASDYSLLINGRLRSEDAKKSAPPSSAAGRSRMD